MSSNSTYIGKHNPLRKAVRHTYSREDQREYRVDGVLARRRAAEEAMRDDVFAALDTGEPAKVVGVHEPMCPLAEWECLLLSAGESDCGRAHRTPVEIDDAEHLAWAEEFERENQREYERHLADLDAQEAKKAESVGRSSRWLPLASEVGGLEALDYGFHADDTSRVSQRFSDAAGYIRVSKLAERLDVPNTALVQYLQGSGEFVKSPSSRVALAVAERIEAHPYLADGLRQVHGHRKAAGTESDRALDALRRTLLG